MPDSAPNWQRSHSTHPHMWVIICEEASLALGFYFREGVAKHNGLLARVGYNWQLSVMIRTFPTLCSFTPYRVVPWPTCDVLGWIDT